jgi:hypothetical protein
MFPKHKAHNKTLADDVLLCFWFLIRRNNAKLVNKTSMVLSHKTGQISEGFLHDS